MYLASFGLRMLLQPIDFTANVVRLRPLHLRGDGGGGVPPPATAGAVVGALGLLHNGCRVAEGGGGALLSGGGGTAAFFLGQPVVANGYFFATSEGGSVAADPVAWVIDISRDNGTTWLEVGASAWRLSTFGNGLDLFPRLPYPTPAAPRGAAVEMDHRQPFQMVIMSIYGGFLWAVFLLSAVAAARAGRAAAVRPLLVAFLLAAGGFLVASAAGLAYTHDWRGSVEAALFAVAQWALALAIALRECRLVAILCAYSVLYGAIIILGDALLYEAKWLSILLTVAQSHSAATAIFAAAVFWVRRGVLDRARRLVLADRARYDAVWTEIVAAPCAARALEDLHSTVEQLRARAASARAAARQLNRRALALLTQPGELEQMMDHVLGVSGTVDPANPVRSLDQLYVQATCLHPILMRKVRAWATASRGCFLRADGGGYVECAAAAAADPPMELKFARVKAVARAIEKLVRAYGQVRCVGGAPCACSARAADLAGWTESQEGGWARREEV